MKLLHKLLDQQKYKNQTLLTTQVVVNQSITQYYDQITELCKKGDSAIPNSLKLKYLMAGIKELLKIHIPIRE